MAKKPLRLGVVGGHRGGSFTVALEHFKKRVKLTAVCDLSQDVLAKWKSQNPDITTFTDWHQMLASDACDAVIIATPMGQHARQAVEAMRAGKHVLSEVAACTTHKEGLELITTAKETGVTYMLAENYCYMASHMMVLNMVNKGVFGELTYAEGMYLHDCRPICFYPDGSLTWRGEARLKMPAGHCYPTHSLGPISQWLGINRENGDRLDTVYSMSNRAHSMATYARDMLGDGKPGTKASDWTLGDSASVLIRTKMGRVIHLRYDANSPRPNNMASHELQGTRAVFRTQIDPHNEPLVWIDGKSPGGEKKKRGHPSHADSWDKLSKYADEFEHPRWKRHKAMALKAGHGGGDFFELEDFLDAVEGRKPCAINVVDAVTWSSIIWLSIRSEKSGLAEKAIDYTAI